MSEPFLLLSSPPHDELDIADLGPIFGLSAAEVRVKANYPSSTIWFASSDLSELQQTARQLKSAGAHVRIIKGKSLTVLSRRHRLRRFVFEDDGMRCYVDADRSIQIPYSWSAAIVSGRPDQMETVDRLTLRQTAKMSSRNKSIRQEARSALADIKEPLDESFVDFYFYELPKVHRFTARPGDTEFSGLADKMKPVVHENIAELTETIGKKFKAIRFNQTMETLPPPRPPFVSGKSLNKILDETEPGLGKVGTYDLSSRFAFLAEAR